jgi:hypothetical protein
MLRYRRSIDSNLNSTLEGTAVLPQTTGLDAVHTILRDGQNGGRTNIKEPTVVVFFGIEYRYSGSAGQ